MKRILAVCLLMLLVGTVFAQNSQPGVYNRAQLLKTITNFTSSTAETTGWYSYPDLLECREAYLLTYATDSVHQTLYIMGRNTALPAAATTKYVDTYADSLPLSASASAVTTALVPRVLVIPLKNGVVDRLEGCNQFRIGTVGLSAAHNGTSTGRVLQYYLVWHK